MQCVRKQRGNWKPHTHYKDVTAMWVVFIIICCDSLADAFHASLHAGHSLHPLTLVL